MWSYYGSKNRLSKYYPEPRHDIIIEPFAGAAYYSLRYFERNIILIDKNPDIISIWEYLQQCSINDIDSLPKLVKGDKIKPSDFDCTGQYNLMRFLITQGSHHGSSLVSPWGGLRLESNIKRIKKNLFKIKHWLILEGDYTSSPNNLATWFIDPPYFIGGHKYPYSNKKINYGCLANWIKTRRGQVIACENTSASWMDFMPIKSQRGVQFTTTEAIWTNYPTSFNCQQTKLFNT